MSADAGTTSRSSHQSAAADPTPLLISRGALIPLMGSPGLDSLPDLFHALLADHAQGQRNRSKASDQDESPSGSFALIIVEPAGKQKADPGAQCDAGSGDEDDLGEGKLPLYHFSNPLSFPALYLAGEQVYSWVSMLATRALS